MELSDCLRVDKAFPLGLFLMHTASQKIESAQLPRVIGCLSTGAFITSDTNPQNVGNRGHSLPPEARLRTQ